MKAESRKFFSALTEEVRAFSFRGLQSRRAVRCAFATTLAALLAFLLHMDMPFWACITALVVTEKTVGATLWKSVLRIMATGLGAAMGLALSLLFSEDTLLFCALIFMVAVTGMYMMNVHKRFAYIWILGPVSALMVMLMGLSDPTSENFIHIAFYRFSEICIGIFSGVLGSLFLFPESTFISAKDQLKTIYSQLASELNRCIETLLSEDENITQNIRDEQGLTCIKQQITALYTNIDPIRHEQTLHGKSTLDIAVFALCARSITSSLTCITATPVRIRHWASSIRVIKTQLDEVFSTLQKVLTDDVAPEALKDVLYEGICYVNDIKLKLLSSEEYKNNNSDVVYIVTIFGSIFDVMYKALISKTADIKEKKRSIWSRIYRHDLFLIKFSLVYAIAVLIVPFTWLLFNFSGFSQIAISIIASVSFSGAATRYKGFQRLIGCFAGCIVAVVFLGLDIDNLAIYLIALFTFCYGLLYFKMGRSEVSYFGIQAAVVFVVGGVAGLSPADSISPSFERLLGIFLGVCALIVVQRFYWNISEYDYARHTVRQMKQALFHYTQSILHRQAITTEWEAAFSFESEVNTLEGSSTSDKAMSLIIESIVQSHRALYKTISDIRMLQDNNRLPHPLYWRSMRAVQHMLSRAYLSLAQTDRSEKHFKLIQQKLHNIQIKATKAGASKLFDPEQTVLFTSLQQLIDNAQACLQAYRKNITYGLEHGRKAMITALKTQAKR